MATPRITASPSLIAPLFIAAGALLGIRLLFALVDPAMTSQLLGFLASAALAVTYLLLFLAPTRDGLLRAMFVLALIGWVLVALETIIPGLGTLGSIASLVALIGTLGSGILVFLRHRFTTQADMAYLVTAIVGALLLLNGIRGFLPSPAVTVMSLVFAVGLVITGLFVRGRR